MLKLLLKHAIAELAIDNIFNGLITNFTPVPVMNGIMEIDDVGNKRWFLHGELHRVDGPAYEAITGNRVWWLNGRLHRVDGPAIEDSDGYYTLWYLYGVEYTKKEYWKQLR